MNRGNRKPDRQEAHSGAHWSRGHRQPNRQGEHIVGHTGVLEHCHLYIEGTDSQSDRGHTVGQSNVHSEGTDNQSERGHTVGHTK